MWTEFAVPFAVGVVLVGLFACVIQIGRWMEREAHGGGSFARLRGCLIIAFGFLGMCVWVPSLAAVMDPTWVFFLTPLGWCLGLLIGYCAIKIVASLFDAEPANKADQETQDAPD